MALRDIYWRVDAYHLLGTADTSSPEEYLQRRDEAIEYLKGIQIIEGDKGVWGVPADFNPETESDFRLQKALYHFMQIGNALANHA
ncbi:MAG: hypothetical protein PF447_11105 [Spirochaetaceae bacterium]|jgi:hypothetical protein|nr:hypothetical protein [Spirochaetaceae bacterium]